MSYPGDNVLVCSTCAGMGTIDVYYNEFDIYEDECPECEGKGEVEK